jgi:4-hydroxybenzoate polyprenyltransferase
VNSLRSFFETIRVEHTVFALPFAYATLFLVAGGWPSSHDFLWITVAMVSARTVGMALNRIIDARIDANNPRTATRAIPAGRLRRSKAWVFTAVATVLYVVAVFQLNPVCRWLCPIPLAAMTLYPYAKRFTSFAHLFLGLVYVMIPAGIWLAVTGTLPSVAVLLGIGAGLWVAGFDIIYACQDVEVDRREGLHSIPADFGIARGLTIARWLHAGFLISLLLVAQMSHTGRWFYLGALLSGLAMLYEHRLVKPNDLSRVNAAFFTTNGFISVILFIMIALDQVT